MDKAVKDDGGKVLWMPPYFPDLHSIELYWSAGKGGFSLNYLFYLRDGWYGNTHHTPSGKMDLRVPEDEDPDFLIEVKKVDFSSSYKN